MPEQVAGGAVWVIFKGIRRIATDNAAEDGVGVLGRQRVFALHLRGKAVGRGRIGPAVRTADARRVQQTDGPHPLTQRHKGALGGGVVVRRHKDIEPAVAEASFHTVLPALVRDAEQLAEDLRIRGHAAALELGVHGVPHLGGSVAVGVDPFAAGDCVQLGPLFLLPTGKVGGGLPCGEILLFQRLFQLVEGGGQVRQTVFGQADRPERFFHGEAAAAQHGQQVRDGVGSLLQTAHLPAGGVQCALFAGQLLGHGVQRAAFAAGGGRPVGSQIGAAGLGFGILGRLIGGIQLGHLAASGVEMPLPDFVLPGVRFGAGQQGRTPVHEGIRLLGRGFPAVSHDLFQCGGAGLRLGKDGVEIFQLHPVAL